MKNLTLCLSAAVLALTASQPASAQGIVLQRDRTVQPLAGQLDASTLQRLDTIKTSYDRRIAAAFDRNPALRDRMKADLGAIGAERDSARKRQMIASYQQTYGAQYSQVLQAGGVDLSAMAREMKAAAPSMDFTLTNRMGIIARPVAAIASPGSRVQALSTGQSSGLRTLGSSTSSPAPSATERRERLRLSDFESARKGTCVNLAGNDANRTSDGLLANSTAVLASGCNMEMQLSRPITVPAGEVAEISLRGVIESEAFALGILGASEALAGGAISLTKVNAQGGNETDLAEFRNVGVSTVAIAALLTSMGAFDEEDIGSRTVTLPAGNYRLSLSGRSTTWAAGIVAGTSGKGVVKQFSGTITYRPAP